MEHPRAVSVFLQSFGKGGPELAGWAFIDAAIGILRDGEHLDAVPIQFAEGKRVEMPGHDLALRRNRDCQAGRFSQTICHSIDAPTGNTLAKGRRCRSQAADGAEEKSSQT